MSDTLTTRQAAELLHQHEHTIEHWAREAKIPAHRIGRKYVYMRDELIQWIREQPAKRSACPSTAEVKPTGSSSPGQAKRRLESLLKPATDKPRRNTTTAVRQNSGDSESSATVRELHSRQPLPTG